MRLLPPLVLGIVLVTAQFDSEEDGDSEETSNCCGCCGGKKTKSKLPGAAADDRDFDFLNVRRYSISNQLEERFKEHTYALSVKPRNANGSPVKVKVTLLIESITDVSEVNMDLTITFVIYQTWTDPRLMIPTDVLPLKSVVLPSRLIQHLWVPDTYVVGSKSSVIHKTTTANQAARIWPTGRVLYSLKLTATVACLMSLHNFPMDTETCSLSLQSFAYDTDEIVLQWDGTAIKDAQGKDENALFMDINLVNNMPKFKIIDHGYNYSTTLFYIKEEGSDTPKEYEKSRLTVTFEFERYFISVFFQRIRFALLSCDDHGHARWSYDVDRPEICASQSLHGNNNCPYYFYDNNGPEIVATSRLLFDGAGHLFVDMLFLCVFCGPGILCSELLMARKGRVRDKLVESRFKNGSQSKNGVALGKATTVVDEKEAPVDEYPSQGLKRRHMSQRISSSHSFDSPHSFSKSAKKIYSIFNVHESPDTARRLDFYFRYLYFLMFALFNAIYWTHVKMAADSSREELAKNFGPDL
ncbi:Oidioi.mRNA.OKI2018_I69.XSR.g15818.t1.cds [Oikopleura dioica]|uniref:Oidioi.mRNA.OKI2018_I69.XSR.g15818.t1.cds n=1 Tax=Oikopleura dioica TaxID=34765 RepID=A0ABN7SE27_OIKDI|nr:Oidioi.mRNA.OKI2018_I69.XSR.g15818.t1.cds [Oikopleura dioica]